MFASRRSRLIRSFALLLLLWVGFDFGAHGVAASDLVPIAINAGAIALTGDGGAAPSHPGHDHCFCHGNFVGGATLLRNAELVPAGTLALRWVPALLLAAPHPLDRPPRLS
jgi:hypothetical protein